MHFEVIKFKEADIRKLSEIYFEWIQNTPFRDDSMAIDCVETQFTKAAQNDHEMVILAFDDSNLHVGWLNTYIGFPEMLFEMMMKSLLQSLRNTKDMVLK